MLVLEFLNSSFWEEIRVRVLATFGLAGAGTAANALPALTAEQTQAFVDLEYAIRWFTLLSYIFSTLVAITVIWKFVIWLKERKKHKNKNK